jgi:outer membrane protein
MKFMVRATLLMLGLILAAGATLEAQQASIVFLDSERLRREAPSLQSARQQMQQEMQLLEQQADSALAPIQQQLQQMAQEFQQQQGMMTAEQRQQRQQEIQQQQQQLQQQGSEWEQRAAAKQNEILAPALERINAVIDQLREENDYAYVLDVAAGGVIAADPELDITEEVLRRLQAQASQDS